MRNALTKQEYFADRATERKFRAARSWRRRVEKLSSAKGEGSRFQSAALIKPPEGSVIARRRRLRIAAATPVAGRNNQGGTAKAFSSLTRSGIFYFPGKEAVQ
jgi:hypothetical protein